VKLLARVWCLVFLTHGVVFASLKRCTDDVIAIFPVAGECALAYDLPRHFTGKGVLNVLVESLTKVIFAVSCPYSW